MHLNVAGVQVVFSKGTTLPGHGSCKAGFMQIVFLNILVEICSSRKLTHELWFPQPAKLHDLGQEKRRLYN